MEREPEDLDEKVDGVARPVPLGPAPIAGFDDEAGEAGKER